MNISHAITLNKLLAGVAFVAFVVLVCQQPATLFITVTLLVGWPAFLVRVIPEVTVDMTSVVSSSVAALLVLVITHSFLRWLAREVGTDEPRRPWRIRWTLSLAAMTLVMFVAGTSMIGATHQVVWLITGDEKMTQPGLPAQYDGATSALSLRMLENQANYGMWAVQSTEGHSWAARMVTKDAPVDLEKAWDDPVNAAAYKRVVPWFVNHDFGRRDYVDDAGYGLIHYAMNERVSQRDDSWRFATDANTLFIGEVSGNYQPWGKAGNYRDPVEGWGTPSGFSGAHEDAIQFLMMDGSIRRIDRDIDPEVLRALSTPFGYETGIEIERVAPQTY